MSSGGDPKGNGGLSDVMDAKPCQIDFWSAGSQRACETEILEEACDVSLGCQNSDPQSAGLVFIDPDAVQVVQAGVVDRVGDHSDNDVGNRLPGDPQQPGTVVLSTR